MRDTKLYWNYVLYSAKHNWKEQIFLRESRISNIVGCSKCLNKKNYEQF